MSRIPLNAVQIFCSVVAHGGIRQAAVALHVTPGAVSKQIRLLEEHVQEVLFDREAGRLATPTLAGARLYDRVAHPLQAIDTALSASNPSVRQGTVVVDTSVTLAMHWLIPMLPRFNQTHQNIRVQVRTTDGAINPATPVDVFIRREKHELRGLASNAFMAEYSVLVCTPTVMEAVESRRARAGAWVQKVPRIGMRSRADLWEKWAVANGFKEKFAATIEYDNTVLAIQAALHGSGALVVPELFVCAMLKAGTLALLSARRIETGQYHYAVGRQRDSRRVAVFTDWLAACGAAGETVDIGAASA